MPVTVSETCSRCHQSRPLRFVPELIARFYNPNLGNSDADETLSLPCTQCQVSSGSGALEALLALAYQPAGKVSQSMIENVFWAIGEANRRHNYMTQSVKSAMVQLVYHHRVKMSLPDMTESVRKYMGLGDDWTTGFLRSLAQYALTRYESELAKLSAQYGPIKVEPTTHELAARTVDLQTADEVGLLLAELDGRLVFIRAREENRVRRLAEM